MVQAPHRNHLARALGAGGVKAGRGACGASLAEIINGLAVAERQGRLAEKIACHARASLPIVDEIGYPTITPGGANLFVRETLPRSVS